MPISFQTFTNAELRRLQTNLRRRFRIAKIIDVAFGPARRANRRDPKRPFCICFFVYRKRNPRDHSQWISRTVNCRLKIKGKLRSFEISTDVVQTRKMKLTGRSVRRPNKTSQVTSGTVVSWKEAGFPSRKWAIVTVGHYFDSSRLPDNTVYLYLTSTGRIFGKFLFRSKSNSMLDVAVVGFEKQDLIHAGLVFSGSIAGLKPRSIDHLKSDFGSQGTALIPPKDNTINIMFEHFFANNEEVDELWKMKDVVRVKSAVIGAFKSGRSGTIFLSNNGQVSLMQFAGTTGNSTEGLGQAYVSIMDWIREQLAAKFNLVADSLQLVSKF